MKFLVQHSYKKKHLIKILINTVILLIFYNQIKQYTLANIQNNLTIQKPIDHQIHKKKTSDITKIKIEANEAKFYLTEDITSYFSGNVIISYSENTLYADEIYLHKKNDHNTKMHILLSGIGNISYKNNIINMTGKKIIADTHNKNIDLYQGNFSLIQRKTTYGSANHIKQRKNNRYTILKNADFTTCPPCKKYWSLSGSQILYDHKKENVDIWNAHFKIKKTSILYIPYTQLSLTYKENSKNHPNIPQYNNMHGIAIKLPYYFNINNNFHGNITTNLMPKQGIQFQNCIQYFNNLNKGSINFDLLNNQKLNKNYWILYFYNDNRIQEKWHIKNEYIKISDYNAFYNTKSKYAYTTDNYYMKKNISWKYADTVWNINVFHREFQSLNKYIKNIYNTKPQINIDYHINEFKLLNYHLFSQLTHFTNTDYNYPKTIRLHIEPSVNILSNILHTNLNTEIKIKHTYYQQRNIDFYNTMMIKNTNKNTYCLKQSVNRCLPQFKSNAKLTLHKKTNIHKKYKQILEPQIQYLYIPYHNQKNIGLYDTTIFETTEDTNLFKDIIYSGLDRIASANQLTSNISTRIYNENNIELFHVSLGQIYFFTPQRTEEHIRKHYIYKNHKNNITWGTNTYWKINQSLGIRSNLQYNTQIKKLESGNTIVEHRTNNNKILQINFRYLNSQYFAQITPEETNPIYKKNITQLGIIGNLPINNSWTFSGTQFYNFKNKHIINQTIGIQYRTCCWKINAGYERKTHLLDNKITNIKKYSNKLLFNLILSGTYHNSKLESKICNMLYTSTLPYQSIL